jgi:gliding motility-associated-like protein
MTEKNIESIFRNTLENYQADVSPSLWQSVQSGIAGKGAAASGVSGAGAGAGTTGLLSKALLWVAGATLVGSAAYFALSDHDAPATQSVKETPVQPAPANALPEERPVETTPVEADVQAPAVTPVIQAKKQHFAVQAVVPAAQTATTAAQPAAPASVPQGMKDEQLTDNTNHPVVQSPAVLSPASQPVSREDVPAAASEKPVSQGYTFGRIEDHLLDIDKLPTAFTPNGDGLNDRFTLRTHDLKSLEVTIFDAGGNLVYQWNGLDGGWNGRLANGTKASQGTYRYSVKAEATDGRICIGYSLLVLRENLHN